MYLFYAPDVTLPFYTLAEEESKHAVRVLRLAVGDTVHLTDGRGTMHRASVVDDNAKRCRVEITESLPQFEKRDYQLTMAVAPTKNIERFEWFLEKATEVGIDRIVPIECQHSERRSIKTERGIKVITSAMKQSLKAYHPQLDELTPFRKLIAEPFDGIKLIAHCEETGEPPKFISDYVCKGDKVLILIGPEGDFSQEEITFATENGFSHISLGRSRLRTETAAVYAVMNVAFVNQ